MDRMGEAIHQAAVMNGEVEEERRWRCRSGDRQQLNSKHLMMQSLHDRATIDTVGAANEFAPSKPLSEPRKDDPRGI